MGRIPVGIDALTAHNPYIRGMGEIVNPDSWYFQVKCHFCGRDFAVAEDPTGARRLIVRQPIARRSITTP